MLPIILSAIELAKKKGQGQNNFINQLSQPVAFNGQAQSRSMLPTQSNGLGDMMSSISSIYGKI
jgi:hypothetical protein